MELKHTNIRIIQASQLHTGSTLLSNILWGLFLPEEKVVFSHFPRKGVVRSYLSKYFLIKTHKENIADLINEVCGHTYDYWIISSNRNNKIYHCAHPNTISFEYEQLLETTSNSIETIVNTVAQKIKATLPNNITDQMNVQSSIQRIKNMNDYYREIQGRIFTFIDPFYQIHGHHRNRSSTT